MRPTIASFAAVCIRLIEVIVLAFSISAGSAATSSAAVPTVTLRAAPSPVTAKVGQPLNVDLSSIFEGATSYAIASSGSPLPEGLSLSGSTISGVATEAWSGPSVIVEGSNGFSTTPAALDFEIVALAPPTALSGPALLGAPLVGETVSVDPGSWDGADEVTAELIVGGTVRPAPYTITPSDDGAMIAARVAATNADGLTDMLVAETRITWRAPRATSSIADLSLSAGDPRATIDAAALVEHAEGGVWSLTVDGGVDPSVATIDSEGLITVLAEAPYPSKTIVARYVNSGGQVALGFVAAVSASAARFDPTRHVPGLHLWDAFRPGAVTLDGTGGVLSVSAATSGTPPLMPAGAGRARFVASDGQVTVDGTAPEPLTATLPTTIGGSAGLTYIFFGVPSSWGGDGGHVMYASDGSGASNTRHDFQSTRFAESIMNAAAQGALRSGSSPRLAFIRMDGASRNVDIRVAFDDQQVDLGLLTGRATSQVDRLHVFDRPGGNGSGGVRSMVLAGVVRGMLSDEQIRKIEGWLKHDWAGSTLNGGPWRITLPFGHPYEINPPYYGAPFAFESAPSMTMWAGLRLDDVALSAYVTGADSFSLVSGALPPGVSLVGGRLEGVPSTAGAYDFTIRAQNNDGVQDLFFDVVVNPVPTVADSDDSLLAMAAAARPGDEILLTSAYAASRRHLRALARAGDAGTVRARLVGFADFVRSTLPEGVEYSASQGVAHVSAAGTPVAANAYVAAHPIWSGVSGAMFAGPEAAHPAPLDHDEKTGRPLGLKIDGKRAMSAGVRFKAPRYDGHVVWLGEFLVGRTLRRAMSEEEATRAANPPFRWPAEMLDGSRAYDVASYAAGSGQARGLGPAATHLRRAVALEIAPMSALAAPAFSTVDPRRWIVPAKRQRDAYPADFELAVPDFAALDAHIARLSISNGAIAGKTPGERYVIRIPAGYYRMPADVQGGFPDRLRFSDEARAVMAAAIDTPVFIVGVPGRTVFNRITLGGDAVTEFGWISFSRPGPLNPDGREWRDEPAIFAFSGRASFFGCTIEFPDGHYINAHIDQASAAIKLSGTPELIFADGAILDAHSTVEFDNVNAYDVASRGAAILARNLLGVSNDLFMLYRNGAVLMEGNYSFGAGGWYKWPVSGGAHSGFAHRDIFGQPQASIHATHVAVAMYDNIAAYRRDNAGNEARRGRANTMEADPGRIDYFELAGNIIEVPGRATKLGGPWKTNLPPDVDATPSMIEASLKNGNFEIPFIGQSVFAYNIYYPRADEGWSGDTYPYRGGMPSFQNADGPVFGALAFGNVLKTTQISGDQPQEAFNRTINLYPDEIADSGASAAYPDAITAFASPPVPVQTGVSSTPTARITLDWAGTTHGGTHLEGYLDAADFAAGSDATPTALARYGAEGGPGLPTRERQAGRYLRLPADESAMRSHLGAGAAGVVRPLFQDHAPAAFTLNHVRPALGPAPAGTERLLFLNTRIARRAPGTVAERIAADGSGWRLELLPGTFRPRWTLFGPTAAGNRTLYCVTSRYGVEDGERVSLSLTTEWFGEWIEYDRRNEEIAQAIWDHAYANGGALPIEARIIASAAEPAGPFDLSGGKRVLWIDKANGNDFKEWTGSAWTWAQGWIVEYMAGMAQARSALLGTLTRDPATAVFDDFDLRHWFVEDLAAFIASQPSGLSTGDLVYAVYQNGVSFAPNNVFRAWNGSTWGATGWGGGSGNNPQEGRQRMGRVTAILRVGGRAPALLSDWVWSNRYYTVDGNTVYAGQTPIPDGPLALGAAATNGAVGLEVNYFEERRQRGARAARLPIDTNVTSVDLRFAQAPIGPGGDRPYFGPAAVWIDAGTP